MIGKHLKQFTNSGINGSALCLLARPMQSHAGQKRFQLFVEKREKCKKNLLVTTHTVTSRYQRWGKSCRESLTLLPSEKAPP